MSKPTTIKEVLSDLETDLKSMFLDYIDNFETEVQYAKRRNDRVDQAIADIQRIIEECKPYPTSQPNHYFGADHQTGLNEGFNSGLEEFEHNLKARLQ